MTTDLAAARSVIAREIGPDAAEFTPAEEKNFVAEAALISMGGMLLHAFFKGMVEETAKSFGKKVGEVTGESLGALVGGFFKGFGKRGSAVGDEALEASRSEAQSAVTHAGLTREQIAQISQAVAAAMATVMTHQIDADPAVTKRVVEKVKSEGLKVIAAKEPLS